MLDSHTPLGEGNDRMIWKLKSNGEFTVRSFYEKLRGLAPMPFPWKAIWMTKAPQRVSFFVWTAAREKTLTCENLIKIGFSMVSRCCMCRCTRETVDHLLIHCSMAFELLSFIFRMFGVQWVLPKKVLDLLCGWQCCEPNSNLRNLIPLYLM